MINRTLNISIASLCILMGFVTFHASAQQVDPIPLADSVVLPELPEGYENASGKVSLIVAVAPDGIVASVNVLSSTDTALNASAIEAIEQWTFTPAYRDDLPVIGMFQHTFRFEEGENLFGQKLWKILNSKRKPAPVAKKAPVEKKATKPQEVAQKPTPKPVNKKRPIAKKSSPKKKTIAKITPLKKVAPVVEKVTPEIAKTATEEKAVAVTPSAPAPVVKASKAPALVTQPVVTETTPVVPEVVEVPHEPRNSPPAPLTEIVPQLPDALKVIHGQVKVRVDIDENGVVQKAFAQSSTHEELESYTIETVKKWEFEPAYENDKPVASKLILPVLFSGQEKAPNLGDIPKVDLIRSLSKPIAIRKTIPELPESLVAESGSATIKFVVTKEGYVSYATVGNASHPEFGKAALDAIYSWKFKPALNEGKEIASQYSQVFQFTGGVAQLRPDPWDKQPIVEHSPAPRMRSSLKNTQGFVLVHLRLDQQGNVKEARVMESTNPKLEKPTIEASYKWKFTPGKKDGKSVESNIIIPFIYPLANS